MSEFDFEEAMRHPEKASRVLVLFGYSSTAIVDYLTSLEVPLDEARRIEGDARVQVETDHRKGAAKMNRLAVSSEFDLSINLNQEET